MKERRLEYCPFFRGKITVKETVRNPKAREMFVTIGGGKSSSQDLITTDAAKARPFVSQLAWALFTAYHAIVSMAVIRLEILKAGFNMPNIVDKEAATKFITAALPHRAEFIAQHDVGAYHYLLDELELRLLEELQKLLRGVESDQASVEQAAEILKKSEVVWQSIAQAKAERGA